MTRQAQLGVALGPLLFLLLCAHPCLAIPSCADVGLACSASPPPPPPPPGDCLTDGTAWTYDAIAECCSGYAFGAYCGCLPAGATVQATAVECCSRLSDGGSPDVCLPPCLKKSATCEDCRDRRRSLQGAGYQQCDCCAGLLCAVNTTDTGSVCAGPPSEPGLGEITDTEVVPDVYTLIIPVFASNDSGAVGIDAEYVVEGQFAGNGSLAFSVSGIPSPLTFQPGGLACGTGYMIYVYATNTAGLESASVPYPSVYNTPACSSP